MLNFPNAPTNGTTFGQWIYDGTKWTQGNAASVSVVNTFNSRSGAVTLTTSDVTAVADATYVNVTGDTMSGKLYIGNNIAAHDPLELDVAQGYYCRTLYNIANTRRWSAGAAASGNYVLADETGATTRVEITPAGDATITGSLTTSSRLQANRHVVSYGGSNPSCTVWNSAGYAGGMWCESGGTLSFGWCNGDGTPVDTRMWIDRSSNFSVGGGVYGNFLQSNGDTILRGNTYIDGGLGITFRGVYNSGAWFAFGWDGSYLQYAINGGGQGGLITWQQGDGRYLQLVDQRVNTNANKLQYVWSSPWIYLTGYDNGGTWYYCQTTTNCDGRLKDNIQPTAVDALDCILRLQVRSMTFKPEVAAWLSAMGAQSEQERELIMARNTVAQHVRIGLIAQEIEDIVPDAVLVSPPDAYRHPKNPLPDEMRTIRYEAFVPYLVRAIQQLTERVETLEQRTH